MAFRQRMFSISTCFPFLPRTSLSCLSILSICPYHRNGCPIIGIIGCQSDNLVYRTSRDASSCHLSFGTCALHPVYIFATLHHVLLFPSPLPSRSCSVCRSSAPTNPLSTNISVIAPPSNFIPSVSTSSNPSHPPAILISCYIDHVSIKTVVATRFNPKRRWSAHP